ncbi:MAG: SRPBCC domain-containing protein [Cyclobacteriaceae bacterium]|nr:SRPBCC domain-containing protein [Cyclobacteriaceae bacterium]
MVKLQFSITIKAPKSKVWDIMLGEATYRKWTEAFSHGAYFVGDWKKGSSILFLGPDEKGKMSGMVSRIKENRLHEYISIEHLGFVQDGIEDTSSEAAVSWAGALENYSFQEKGTSTVLTVDTEVTEEYKSMFETSWPKSLKKIKEMAEA